MNAVTSVTLPLIGRDGRVRGSLEIASLPRTRTDPPPLLDLRYTHERSTEEPVQLLEATEYRFRIEVEGREPHVITTNKPDIFDADTPRGREGRLRTGLHTGLLRVAVLVDGVEIGNARFEVRSRKLDYARHYRWMLSDIAEILAELVMERFAPTAQRFRADEHRDSRTLYQRFAFLRSLLESERFDRALGQILARPHRAWVEEPVLRRPGQGFSARRDVAVQFARGYQRVPWRGGLVGSLPATVIVTRPEETRDTAENRFVKFVLLEWRYTAFVVGEAMRRADSASFPIARGVTEADTLVERLDGVLAHPVFREVGAVSLVPFASQVLHKRDGYRDILNFYLQAELAAALDWTGGDEVYGAGQRNVAVLYEFWTFLQMAKLIADLCGAALDPSELITESSDGLGVVLRRGRTTTVRGRVSRLGCELDLELRFNQSFGASSSHESWTVRLRPDISLRIAKVEPSSGPVWLHFDAKYKLERLGEIFVDDNDEREPRDTRSDAKRGDIVKMHAYKDAIRLSGGAYVLFPGTENEQRYEHHEILPGIGAFSLRPSDTGTADGIRSVAIFIDEVLTQIASQFTQHARARHWIGEVFRPERPHSQVGDALQFLRRPPIDSSVLVAPASGTRLAVVRQTGRYEFVAKGSLPTAMVVAEFMIVLGDEIGDCEIRPVVADPEVRANLGGDEMTISLVLGHPISSRNMDAIARKAHELSASGYAVVSWQAFATVAVNGFKI